MSWIKDVKADLTGLDYSRQSLQRFAWLVGSVLLLIGIYLYYKKITSAAAIVSIPGLLLLIASFIAPASLKRIYTIWMALAFLIGWLVSRILLTFIFYLLVAPIGLVAKVFGKHFLEIGQRPDQNSYWVKKNKTDSNYGKLY